MRPTLKTFAQYQWSMKPAILGKCWTILGSQIYSEDAPQFWFKNSVWRQGSLSASFWQKQIRKWTKSWRQGFHRARRGWWGNSGWYLCLCVFVYSCSCIVVYFCICICIFTNSVWRQDSLPVGRGRWGNPGWGWLCEPSSPERGFVKKWQFCVITTANAERLMMTTMMMMVIMTLTIASSRVRLVFCRRNASVIVEDRDLPEKLWKPSNCSKM